MRTSSVSSKIGFRYSYCMYCKQLLYGRSLNWILVIFFIMKCMDIFFFYKCVVKINVLFKCEVLIM